MGRQMPEYCEHGTLVCAGDFADPEDVQECPLCHIESLPVKIAAKDKRIAELEKVAEAAEIDIRRKNGKGWVSAEEAGVWKALRAAGYLGGGE